jgi:hypothetical protein
MSSNYDLAVDAFLNQFKQIRATTLNKIWKAFMAYSMVIMAEAFQARGFTVTPMNHQNGFRFKCFPAGDPKLYSYFLVNKDKYVFEVRLSVDSRNLRWNSLKLNLDAVVIQPDSIGVDNVVDSDKDLVAFVECKNYRGFPELVATFEGMVYELQRSRLYTNSANNYRIPACLFLSQLGRSILFMDRRYQKWNMSMRIFDLLQPGNPNVQNFINVWF